MKESDKIIAEVTSGEYEHGFETVVEQDFIPKGLNEDIIRLISRKKEEPEWLLEFRLKAFRRLTLRSKRLSTNWASRSTNVAC